MELIGAFILDTTFYDIVLLMTIGGCVDRVKDGLRKVCSRSIHSWNDDGIKYQAYSYHSGVYKIPDQAKDTEKEILKKGEDDPHV